MNGRSSSKPSSSLSLSKSISCVDALRVEPDDLDGFGGLLMSSSSMDTCDCVAKTFPAAGGGGWRWTEGCWHQGDSSGCFFISLCTAVAPSDVVACLRDIDVIRGRLMKIYMIVPEENHRWAFQKGSNVCFTSIVVENNFQHSHELNTLCAMVWLICLKFSECTIGSSRLLRSVRASESGLMHLEMKIKIANFSLVLSQTRPDLCHWLPRRRWSAEDYNQRVQVARLAPEINMITRQRALTWMRFVMAFSSCDGTWVKTGVYLCVRTQGLGILNLTTRTCGCRFHQVQWANVARSVKWDDVRWSCLHPSNGSDHKRPRPIGWSVPVFVGANVDVLDRRVGAFLSRVWTNVLELHLAQVVAWTTEVQEGAHYEKIHTSCLQNPWTPHFRWSRTCVWSWMSWSWPCLQGSKESHQFCKVWALLLGVCIGPVPRTAVPCRLWWRLWLCWPTWRSCI